MIRCLQILTPITIRACKRHFGFVKSFEHLTRSRKYEDFRLEISDLQKYDEELTKNYKESNLTSYRNYNHLSLRDKIVLCDSLNSKYLAGQGDSTEFKKFFDLFFRTSFRLLLQDRIENISPHKDSFLNSVDPALHLKMLYYYAKFCDPQNIDENEYRFLTDYFDLPTSQTYDYDSGEVATLIHAIYKLNMKISDTTMLRFVEMYYSGDHKLQFDLFYGMVKLCYQRNYFNKNLMELLKKILLKNSKDFNSKVIVFTCKMFASFYYYDQQVINLLEQTILKNDNMRFKDVTNYLRTLVAFGYDFDENSFILQSTLKRLINTFEYIDYKKRSIDVLSAIESLIISNIYNYDLIGKFLNHSSIRQELTLPKMRAKFSSKLYFIVKSLEIEQPNYVIDHELKNAGIPCAKDLQIEFKIRPDYVDFIKYLEFSLDCKHNIEFVYPLPHFNSSSVYVNYWPDRQTKKSILIEIVDSSNTIHDSPDQLRPVYKCKLRQMRAKGFHFVMYRKTDDNNFIKI